MITETSEPEAPSIRETIYDFFAKEGVRRTAQREAIIEAVLTTNEHFHAEELLDMAKKIDASVSRATVYRTIPLLVSSGLLRELDLGKEVKYYDPNFVDHPTHNHLICIDCDKIIEFEDPNMELLENCITRRLGFSPATKMVRIEAHCDEFARTGKCDRRTPPAPVGSALLA